MRLGDVLFTATVLFVIAGNGFSLKTAAPMRTLLKPLKTQKSDSSGNKIVTPAEKLLSAAQRLRQEALELENRSISDSRARVAFEAPDRPMIKEVYGKSAMNATEDQSKEAAKELSKPPLPIVVNSFDDDSSRRALIEKMGGKQQNSSPTLFDATGVSLLNKTSDDYDKTPTLDEVFALVNPAWMRWLTRLAANSFVDNFPPEQKKLAEKALAMEVKEFIESVETDVDIRLMEAFSDVDTLDTRIRRRMERILRGQENTVMSVEHQLEMISNFTEKYTQDAKKWTQILNSGAEYSKEDLVKFLSEVQGYIVEKESPSDNNILLNMSSTNGIISPNSNDSLSPLKQLFNSSLIAEEDAGSMAERLISTHFDPSSFTSGEIINRAGAGRFQSDILNGIFRVSDVKLYRGAAIFEGFPNLKSTERFYDELAAKLEASDYSRQVKFMLVKNERYPNFDEGISKIAMDSLLNSNIPTVIVYPIVWNTTASKVVSDNFRRTWKNILSVGACVTSVAFATECFPTLSSDQSLVSEDLSNLALFPIFMQSASSLAEQIFARTRNFTITTTYLPTLLMGSFGSRTTYTSPPRNRNDMFDTAAIGVLIPIIMSLVAMYTGFSMTLNDASVVNTYPQVPLSLLEANTLVAKVISSQYPGIFDNLDVSPGAIVHLHWLVIGGAISLIGSVFQLLPFDNSAGFKMGLATLGFDNFSLLSILSTLGKFLFMLPFLFLGLSGNVDQNRVLVDYLLMSQIASGQETQQAIDNLSEISEGRKIFYFGFTALLLISLLPFGSWESFVSTSADNLTSLFRGALSIK